MLDESESVDVASSATMNVQSMRGNVDQPFVRALGVSSGDRIYVGVNDFNQSNGQTATIDVSVDGGATYKSVRIERRKTAGQDGPSVRPAVANDGTVYAAFFGWRKFDGKTATSDVVVVRDDAAATGASPFQALTDPSDKLPGRVVVKNASIPWSNAPALGQERIGSTLSIAVDPNKSSIVRSEEHTSELQSRLHLVCRLLLEKKKRRTGSLPSSELAASASGSSAVG